MSECACECVSESVFFTGDGEPRRGHHPYHRRPLRHRRADWRHRRQDVAADGGLARSSGRLSRTPSRVFLRRRATRSSGASSGRTRRSRSSWGRAPTSPRRARALAERTPSPENAGGGSQLGMGKSQLRAVKHIAEGPSRNFGEWLQPQGLRYRQRLEY